jgi:hypothetical protein
MSLTKETYVVDMRIWCIKIVNVLVSHFNPRVEGYAGGLLVAIGVYSPVSKYLVLVLKYEYELNFQETSKFCKFISKQRIISLKHSSIVQQIWLRFVALCFVFIRLLFQFSSFILRISNFFDLRITEET